MWGDAWHRALSAALHVHAATQHWVANRFSPPAATQAKTKKSYSAGKPVYSLPSFFKESLHYVCAGLFLVHFQPWSINVAAFHWFNLQPNYLICSLWSHIEMFSPHWASLPAVIPDYLTYALKYMNLAVSSKRNHSKQIMCGKPYKWSWIRTVSMAEKNIVCHDK